MLTILETVSTCHPSRAALPEAVVTLQRSHAAEWLANCPRCVLPPRPVAGPGLPSETGWGFRLSPDSGVFCLHFLCGVCAAFSICRGDGWQGAPCNCLLQELWKSSTSCH